MAANDGGTVMSNKPRNLEEDAAYQKYCNDRAEEDARDGIKPLKYYIPFDDFVKYFSSGNGNDSLLDAAIIVDGTFTAAKKIIQQGTGKEAVDTRDIIELTALIIARQKAGKP
jgi:hypothetical protein